MLSEDEIIAALKELYDGKPVAFSKIKRKLKCNGEELLNVLEKMEKSGKIKKIESGGGKAYEILEIDKTDIILSEIREIKDEIRKLQEYISEKKKISEDTFDAVYDKVKDNLGYAHLQAIRIELGMAKEEFYSKLKHHIEDNYDFIAGGEEGYVRKGSIYGIIKRRGE